MASSNTARGPLAKRNGSPRPDSDSWLSAEIFGIGERRTWNAARWLQWLDDIDGDDDGALEPLLREDENPLRDQIVDHLLTLYALPVARPTTRAAVTKIERSIRQANRELIELQQMGISWLPGAKFPPEDLSLKLTEASMKLGNFSRGVGRAHLEDVAETHLLARLTALAHLSTGHWQDAAIAGAISLFLGRSFAEGVKARSEWRRRNRGLIRAYMKSFRR
jgi:hypothetical protein